jgi:hypothetical protein
MEPATFATFKPVRSQECFVSVVVGFSPPNADTPVTNAAAAEASEPTDFMRSVRLPDPVSHRLPFSYQLHTVDFALRDQKLFARFERI